MGIRPDFTPNHVRDLKALGFCDEQVSELRKALLAVRQVLVKQPKNGETRDLLADVESLSARLLTKLIAIACTIDLEHAKAGALIETSYWKQRPHDQGNTAMIHLIPRLRALQEAALYGLAQVPAGQPVRQRSADPAPIERIDTALIYGWFLAHSDGPSYSRGTRCEEAESAAAIQAQDRQPRPEYPKVLRPSASPSSAFRIAVGICYQAVGGNSDPERAIKEYMKRCRQHRTASVEATMKLFAEPPKKSRR